ncbi:CU044_5270 family protein [Streptoverticillium reticulum]|uniref:CU044_5270 family protein n=1 Tax=Streptoverticillium reticulum TaxID=1433415 RepID=UPI0039BF129C
MNTTEREELSRLLPPPAERDLPPGRHLHHKERLMRQIDRDRALAATVRRRLLRPAVLMPATALAVAGVLIATLPDAHRTQTPAEAPRTEAASGRGAVVLLDRIAAVAMKSGTGPVREDQYVYLRGLTTETVHYKPVKVSEPKEWENWLPQRSAPRKDDQGLLKQDGKYFPVMGDPVPAGLDRPTYQWLASLPTDPDALYERLRKEVRPVKGQDGDQTVFEAFGGLLSAVMPPETEAALYKAAAKIPGVVEIPDATDAKGRHGIAIAREDKQLGERTEWVFDRQSLGYLGSRTCLTRTSDRGTAGTLVHATAVLERAVVDAPRQTP